jgi:antigen flippase
MNYLISMVRTKAVAIFLGPTGVGLVGLYITAVGFVAAIAGLGINSSAVREIAEADASGDASRLGRSIRVLRRTCWATGFLGWALTAIFAWPLSVWTFGSGERAWALAILGLTVLLGSVSGGQTALLQGRRCIGALARFNVVSVVISSLVSVAIYAWLRESGIIPVLLLSGVITLASSWWFARRIDEPEGELTWRETWPEAKRMIHLGLAFMWSGVMAGVIALVTRALIVREFGLDANGIYQAAWALSGMFAGFILGAMGTDFYPRLTAAAHDDKQINRLVNEQTEIGILLALPGLLGTLAFAPWVMHVFYTEKFLPGAALLPWFVLGILGKVISWPMGFIMIAKGESRWFAASETISNMILLALTIYCMRLLGLWGIALAFTVLYTVLTVGVYWIARHLTGFHWSPPAMRLLVVSGALVFAGFAAQKWSPGNLRYVINPLFPALRSGHRLFQRPSPEKQIPSSRTRSLLCGGSPHSQAAT